MFRRDEDGIGSSLSSSATADSTRGGEVTNTDSAGSNDGDGDNGGRVEISGSEITTTHK